MKKLIFTFFILCAIQTMSAQNKGILRGQILDKNNLSLPGATIFIKKINNGVISDFNGNFTMLNIPIGKYELTVSYLGYQTYKKSIEITPKTLEITIILKENLNVLNEIVIFGNIAKGQAKALNKQKNNDNITNVVSADQVGKFPDANTGDAIKRISGIAVQNDQGEARDVIIRGMAPQLNSVTLNGDRLPSAEGGNRRIQLDLIPSDMIQTIEVSKTVTPDMEADAIGGSVNLVTRSAPSKFRASVTGSFGRNPVRSTSLYNTSAILANRFFNNKLGAVISGSYNSNNYGSDNVEFDWKNASLIKEHDIRRYDVKRIRRSISLNLDWKINPNHTIEFKSIYNHRDDWENRYRLRYKYDDNDTDDTSDDEYKITRQTKGGIGNEANNNTRLESQKTYKLSLKGNHILFNSVQLDWKVGIAKASEERPNERYITYTSKQNASTITQRYLNSKTPFFDSSNRQDNDASLFKLDEISEERRYTQEKKTNAKLNIKFPINVTGNYVNTIKLGYNLQLKDKLRDNNYYDYDVDNFSQYKLLSNAKTEDKSLSGFLAGSQYQSGIFANNSFLGGLTLTNGKLVLKEFLPKNYNAEEKINAFYVMLKQKIGNNFSFITGIRLEHTGLNYKGYKIDTKQALTLADATIVNSDTKYTNILPNLQLKYTFLENTNLRFAYTNTIARPNYYDIVPYENYNSKDLEANFGNPDLKTAKSINFDFMAEHYFSNVGVISGSLFYKSIDGFIYNLTNKQNITINGNTEEYDVTKPFNGGTAKVYGFELALQRKLDFLPSFLKNLTFYGNYTHTGSKTNGIENRKDGLSLAGAVKNMFNTSLAYETKKISIRTSLNYAGDYIDEYGSKAFNDRFYDSQLFLDVNTSYAVTKKLRVFGEIKNITNQELRYYQGEKQRTMQSEFYNLNWNLGLKYNF